MHWLAVALGGSLGAVARYALSQWVVRRFPVGTFVVNVVGCLLIGFFVALSVKMKWPGPTLQAFIVGGFLGSLTTFSTFVYQSYDLTRQDSLSLGILNLAANLVVGLLLVWLGVVLGERLSGVLMSE